MDLAITQAISYRIVVKLCQNMGNTQVSRWWTDVTSEEIICRLNDTDILSTNVISIEKSMLICKNIKKYGKYGNTNL